MLCYPWARVLSVHKSLIRTFESTRVIKTHLNARANLIAHFCPNIPCCPDKTGAHHRQGNYRLWALEEQIRAQTVGKDGWAEENGGGRNTACYRIILPSCTIMPEIRPCTALQLACQDQAVLRDSSVPFVSLFSPFPPLHPPGCV